MVVASQGQIVTGLIELDHELTRPRAPRGGVAEPSVRGLDQRQVSDHPVVNGIRGEQGPRAPAGEDFRVLVEPGALGPLLGREVGGRETAAGGVGRWFRIEGGVWQRSDIDGRVWRWSDIEGGVRNWRCRIG